ncbi:ABC transporter substrate-binding protein [Flavobacterium okayamense]|nr:ABC transporter substrate-binding protein [Flavobacterium okayamense]
MKFKYLLLTLFLSSIVFSQQNQLWKGYFSYKEIVDVANGNNKVFAATENSLFYKDLILGDVSQVNSINGFKPEAISCIYHSSQHNITFAGNTNGLILAVKGNGDIVTKVDIIEEVPVPPNQKKVNHFYEFNDKLYISTDYGISVLNLQTLEFEITYFIGTAGEEIKVLQTTVFNNEIYAVTENIGIRKGNLNNPFLYDFSQWQTFDTGFWTGIVTFNNQIVAQNSNSRTYRYNGTSFVEILNTIQNANFIKATDDYIIITTPNHVFVLNTSLVQVAHITGIPDYSVTFSSSIIVNDNLFIGTEKDGVFSCAISNQSIFENITPNGPERNYVFRVKSAPNKLWAVYGSYTLSYNPIINDYGISYFQNETGWFTYPIDDLLGVKCFSDIGYNPNNPSEVYFSSYNSGLLKLEGDNSFTLFNHTNTGTNGLEQIPANSVTNIFDGSIRTNSPTFDKDGNLWLTSAFVTKGLKVLRSNGQWQSYELANILEQAQVVRFAPIAIDKNGTKWLPTRNDGVLAFNDDLNNKFIVIDDTNGLPTTIVQSIAIDNNNQVWMGTMQGLRIISSANRFLSENELTATNIIIQEGDLAQELFYQQPIIDIAVDGANRKWVSIADGGVFLVSPNGQQTIYRFDKLNSPLPSNNVLDIEINGETGEVYFASDKGLVSFLGTSTKPSEDLEDVFVYPNPVRPEYVGTIKISGLMDKCNVKITDIEGNLVFETTSAGGTIEWDGRAFGKHKVASGVYMVFVATEDGLETTVKKIMVIR